MITINKKEDCSGCYSCASICPKNCIEMKTDNEGFWYPHVEEDLCVHCGMCERVCPIINKWQFNNSYNTVALGAINNNEEIRLNSSSGGIFTLIAQDIIKRGGVVFGASFSDDYSSVSHICVDSVPELEKLRGSKYLQSKIGDTYVQAREYLERGRLVLFSGTPCQVGGLYSYLKKDYENLFTQDIVCHGVPSPAVWKKYKELRELQSGDRISSVSFRCKESSWRSYRLIFEFSNGAKYDIAFQKDLFMKSFLANLCLRPSCYNCSFKALKRQSDITLADFWGVWEVCPELFDDKGTSLILVHSHKGDNLINRVNEQIIYKKVDLDSILKYNRSAVESVKIGKREAFMQEIVNNDFEKTVAKYTKVTTATRICNSLYLYFNNHFKK